MFFPTRENLAVNLPKNSRGIRRIIQPGGTKSALPSLNGMLEDIGKNVMRPLSGLGRNGVVGIVALVAIVVFPLIADAQLGRSSAAIKTASDVSPVAEAGVKTTAAKRDSCADQHWPFFSAECLRGSKQKAEPRLVSMNEKTAAESTITAPAPKLVRTAEPRDPVASVGSKKPAKRRIAAHKRERTTPNVKYAVNLEASHVSMPGW